MGLLNKIMDNFKAADFTVAPNKKLKTISTDFKANFGVSLFIYKGKHLADDSLTINQLNKMVSADIKTSGNGLRIKASMKVGDAEKEFEKHYGLTVQIKDITGKKLVPNSMTIGEASRTKF
ncbi:MAG: hypothetical protein R3Y04_00140 [Rikenellaceae bacterium]